MWLDNWASNVVAQAKLHPDLWNVVRGFDGVDISKLDEVVATRSYRDAAVLSRACPICRKSLQQNFAVGAIEVDACRDHGTFFDQNEVQAIHNAVALKQAQLAERAETKLRVQQAVDNSRGAMDKSFFQALIDFAIED